MMDTALVNAAKKLVAIAFTEDLHDGKDVTSESLIAPDAMGSAKIVSRDFGIVCGLEIIPIILEVFSSRVELMDTINDGDRVHPGTCAAELRGNTIDLLKAERTILNFMGRLSGVASLTAKFVEQVHETKAKVFDTRKTTPGWRLLEKYAVHCGGGKNHRMGLFDAVLIKDNHLAAVDKSGANNWIEKVESAIRSIRSNDPKIVIQIEVDTLEQLEQVLPMNPDIILLDNMTESELVQAVGMRGELAIELEASGGVSLKSVQGIAHTGVDRISIGALTHSAVNFDWGLDWSL